jgi:hypothetical protein
MMDRIIVVNHAARILRLRKNSFPLLHSKAMYIISQPTANDGTTMKYDDGQYHVEYLEFEYLGGVKYWDYCIVNVYGEICHKNGNSLRYVDRFWADKLCNYLNQCPNGAIITNLT